MKQCRNGGEGIVTQLKGMGSMMRPGQKKETWSKNWGLISSTPLSAQGLWKKGPKRIMSSTADLTTSHMMYPDKAHTRLHVPEEQSIKRKTAEEGNRGTELSDIMHL